MPDRVGLFQGSDEAVGSWTYRCAECGTGEHLTACAEAISYGPIGRDGELATHDDVTDTQLCEDSIQCSEHPDGEIQRFVDGEWRRWFCCEVCRGTGNRNHDRARSWPYSGNWSNCTACERGRRAGWLIPAEETARA